MKLQHFLIIFLIAVYQTTLIIGVGSAAKAELIGNTFSKCDHLRNDM
uniref:Uncharacterized protein n=1 Tax=Romanomermis culicivorax TaxID=13658 RepID=A0A915LC04_ROMCU